ncbi:MAG: alpha/beta fold hydrolase [Candidatus Lokiarchaeota archaeon]|nr:alpha/beta fold hydrolase [Candidatus Lokiarchaeota archaeon]MBD3199057.1 alpha/beta fold hydrolase [Candidatus Lokiarchaeota archaeon]
MKRDFLKVETFEGTYPFKPHYEEINGFNMHYVDEGEGDPIVCVHGMPTWSFLYRKFIKTLSQNHRVIAPDQMGFGKSDVPQDKEYIMEEHVENLTKLLLRLELNNITLVIQDWGGPIGLGFAVDHPERISRLVIMNTSVGVMKAGRKPWYAPLVEKGIYKKFIMNIGGVIKGGIYNKEKISEIMINAYKAPFPVEEYYIGAFAWPKDIPVGEDHPSAEIMKHVRSNLNKLGEKEKILIWGMKDPIFPKKMIEWWKRIYSDIDVYKIEDASHFLQEDAPEEIISIIKRFLK